MEAGQLLRRLRELGVLAVVAGPVWQMRQRAERHGLTVTMNACDGKAAPGYVFGGTLLDPDGIVRRALEGP